MRPARDFPDPWRDNDPSRMVLPDPAFFRKGRGLASDVRAIVVLFLGAGKGREIVTQIFEQLDWDALAALLEAPPK